jgi:peptidoglycan/LPS O-acetylase OafA/YrhL
MKITSTSQPYHLPQLDGLRGIAITLVTLGHLASFSLHRWVAVANAFAQLGVLLFFVLSGFLITTLVTAEKQKNDSVNLASFYSRRILRLAPAFLAFMAAVICLMFMNLIPRIPGYEIAACFLYMRNIFGRNEAVAHLWSLSLEEQFYIAWPPLVKLLAPNRLIIISISGTVILCVWRAVAMSMHLFDYNMGIYYMRPYFRFDSILVGCCLALCLRYRPLASEQFQSMFKRIPTALIWGLVCVWTLIGQTLSSPMYITVQMLGVTWLLFRAISAETSGILTASPLKFLGKLSYSLYLWQQIFLVTTFQQWGIVGKFPFNVITCFIIALVSYFGVERPFLKLKTRWQPRIATLAAAEAP